MQCTELADLADFGLWTTSYSSFGITGHPASPQRGHRLGFRGAEGPQVRTHTTIAVTILTACRHRNSAEGQLIIFLQAANCSQVPNDIPVYFCE